MNYKNLLQEYYQKKGQSLPVYKTTMVTNSKPPLFVCSLSLPDKEEKFITTSFPNKKAAEQNAAFLAFELIASYQTKPKSDLKDLPDFTSSHAEFTIWIDGENQQKAYQQLAEHFDMNTLDVRVVVSRNHPLASSENLPIYVAPTVHKDGADVAMAYILGFVMAYDQRNHLILTSDHFAAALTEIINHGIHQIPKGIARHFCTVQELIVALKS